MNLTTVKTHLFLKQLEFRFPKSWLLISPYGIGDTYFLSGLASAIQAATHHPVHLIVKPSHASIPSLFSPNIQTHIIPNLTAGLVSSRPQIRPGQAFIAHPAHVYNGILLSLMGQKDINLFDCYKIMFSLSLTTKISLPKLSTSLKKDTLQQFIQAGGIPKRSVILAPYAYSTAPLPVTFWYTLSHILHSKGYKVFTNIGNDKETPLVGTLPLKFSISEAIGYAEAAGYVIALRSGLCDILSSSHAHIQIIYPDEPWHNTTIFNACSLQKMGISSSAEEYIYKPNESLTLKEILATYA